MESKTYVFGNEGSTSNNGMLGLLAPLLQKQGVDPNVLLAMKGNNGFGGEGGWFMWVIFLFFLMGWGGNGWGGFGNNGRGGLANEINNDYGRGLLMDAIGGNRNALSNLATQLNCTEGQIQSADRGLTYSNLSERRSVLAIGECKSDGSIINTIGHEILHVVAHICEQDGIDMLSEEPCYIMGSLCEKFFDVSSVNNVN